MKRVILEGTEHQVKVLIGWLKTIEVIGDDMPTLREDYQTENLWQIEDVKTHYNCSDAQALDVLERALTNDATMNQIWEAIDAEAEWMEIEKKEEQY